MAKVVKAQLKYLHIAPRKVRSVADLIRGLPVTEAEAQLMINPRRSAKPLLKLLRSAVANAKSVKNIDLEKLAVTVVKVDGGPMLKRFMPRARGSASPIQKKMSHVYIQLEESARVAPRFKIIVTKRVKKTTESKKEKKRPQPEAVVAAEKPKSPGLFKKVFRRKTGE